MEHWFYTEDGKPKSADSFDEAQMKQFLEEFGDKIIKVGDEITKEERLFYFTNSLTCVINYLKEAGIDFNKARLEIGCEEDYDCSYDYIAVFYKTPAQEVDVENYVYKTFHERYAVYKASYDNCMRWQDKHNFKKNYFVDGQQELKTLGK